MTAPELIGDRVVLRPSEERDVAARQALGWHASIERGYGHESPDRPMTSDEAHAWLDRQQTAAAEHDARHWVIETDGQLAGGTFLHSISEVDRKARFAIGMFHPRFLGRGLGTEATRLVLTHAFGTMQLHRVDLRVLAFNAPAIASYLRCGFVEEGRERESCWLEGRWHDDVILGLLAHEFPPGSTSESAE